MFFTIIIFLKVLLKKKFFFNLSDYLTKILKDKTGNFLPKTRSLIISCFDLIR